MNDYLKSDAVYRCETCGYEWKPTVLQKQYMKKNYLLRWSAGYYIAHCPKCAEGIARIKELRKR